MNETLIQIFDIAHVLHRSEIREKLKQYFQY